MLSLLTIVRRGHFNLSSVSASTPDPKMLEVPKDPVEIRDPQDEDNHYNSIQDRFDLTLHWDKPVHKPQQKTCCNKRDQDSGKWHTVFSDRLPLFDPHTVSGPENRKRLVHLLSI